MPRVKVPISAEQTDTAVVTGVMEALAQVVTTAVPIPAAPVYQTPRASLRDRFTAKQLVTVGASALFVLLLIAVISLISDRNHLKTEVSKLSNNSATAGATEVKQLTAEIGQFFQLPTGETPTLATVSDASKVRNQAFFKDANNGDKVLLYSKAGEAILYRPSTKKIIAVAPVNLNNTGSSNSSSSASTDASTTTR